MQQLGRHHQNLVGGQLLQLVQLLLPAVRKGRGDQDVVPSLFTGQAGAAQGEGKALAGALRNPAQQLHDAVKMLAAQSLLGVGRECGQSRRDGVGHQAVLDVVLLELFADRADERAALVYFFFVLKDVEHRLDVEQDGDRQVDGVVVVFDHHPAQTRALGPADVAHRLASGVLGKADGQHRVLKDEAVDRNVPDDAAEHPLQLRRLHLTGHDHDLFKQREFLVGVLDAQKVAAVHIAS